MVQLAIVFLAAFSALGQAEQPKKLNFREALQSIQQDMAHKVVARAEEKSHPKLKAHKAKAHEAEAQAHDAQAEEKSHHKAQVDQWANCGEPVAFWGEGKDRSTCPCKPDPSKNFKPILEVQSLEDRYKLLEKSREHNWKLKASNQTKWMGQFYINLASSTKRREFIESQLKEIAEKRSWDKSQKIPMTQRWAAVDYKSAARANLKEFTDEGLNDYVKKMDDREKWGTLATYMSHLRLLRRIWSNDKEGEGLYVIMEDDGTLNTKWQLKVEEALQKGEIPKDWDMIKFGYWGLTRCEDRITNSAYEARTPMVVGDGTRKTYYNGNLGYIVRPKSIPAILAAARKQSAFDVDGVFVAMNQNPSTEKDYGIKTYYMTHSLVKGGTGGQYLATDRLGTPEEQEASAKAAEAAHKKV